MIQDEHVVDSTPHVRRAKVLVGWVWEVGIAVGFGVEGQREAVGEAVVLALGR